MGARLNACVCFVCGLSCDVVWCVWGCVLCLRVLLCIRCLDAVFVSYCVMVCVVLSVRFCFCMFA